MNAPDESAENQFAISQKLAVPFSKAATLLGATEDMVPAVESALGGVLARGFIGVMIVLMGVMVLSHSDLLFCLQASLQTQ